MISSGPYIWICSSLFVLFLINLCVTYYCFTWRKGYAIDVWTVSQIFLIVPLVIAYPYAASPFNAAATGGAIEYFYPYVDDSFLISSVGLIFVQITFWCSKIFPKWDKLNQLPAKYYARPVKFAVMNNPWLQWWIAGLLMVSFAAVSIAVYRGGSLFNLRGALFMDAEVRPLFNLLVTILPFYISISYARLFDGKGIEKILFGIFAILGTGMLMVSGSRSSAILPVLVVLSYLFMTWKRSSALIGLLVIVPLAVGLTELLGRLRYGADSEGLNLGLAGILFYGNNFSDLRDFAWILAGWDGQFLYGKTLVAGWLGFIPSFILPFRRVWAWGPWSLETAFGQVFEDHPGLRPGPFGEFYFNLGIPGVVVLGILLGCILVGMDSYAKQCLQAGNNRVQMIIVATSIAGLGTFLQVSAGGFALYSFWLGIGTLWFLKQFLPLGEKPRFRLAKTPPMGRGRFADSTPRDRKVSRS